MAVRIDASPQFAPLMMIIMTVLALPVAVGVGGFALCKSEVVR